MISEKLFVVVFNPLQNQLHIETVLEMVRNNREIFLKGAMSPWYVLDFAESKEQANMLLEEYQKANPKKTSELPE